MAAWIGIAFGVCCCQPYGAGSIRTGEYTSKGLLRSSSIRGSGQPCGMFVGVHVRRIARDLRETLANCAESLPTTWSAFLALEAAIAEELPGEPKRKRGKKGKPSRCLLSKAQQIKLLRNQLAYTRRWAAEDNIKDAAQGKETGQAQWTRVPWLVRVCLSQPLTSCRAFAQAHADFIGSSVGRKGVGCSRFTITRIKDAFVEVCKELNAEEIRQVVRRTKAEAEASKQRVFQEAAAARAAVCWNAGGAAAALAMQDLALVGSFTLLHIHDEARLRLRTFGEDDRKPTRSRSSMVQQHAV